MKTNLNREIKSEKDARRFLFALKKNGETFSPDDDAHEIGWSFDPPPTFQQCEKLNSLMADVVKHMEDPYTYLIGLDHLEELKQLLQEKGVYTDPWGAVLGLHFDICATLTEWGDDIPAEWEYKPGMRPESETDFENFNGAVLVGWGNILSEAADNLRMLGLNY